MLNLSKSKLLAYRQCPKRLWLEVHRPDLQSDASDTEVRFQVGHQVGEIARRIYDPSDSGTLVNVQSEGFGQALARSSALLASTAPLFEAGFAAEGALVFADIMLPVGTEPKHCWRMVEIKSSTGIKDYHYDDVAIQAFVALAAGVPLKSIALAHIDGDWLYPGHENYQGLLIENDLTKEAFKRGDEVRAWIGNALAIVGQDSEPSVRTGAHCSNPFECSLWSYCRSQEPQAEYPVEWLPRLHTNAVKEFIQTNAIIDLRDVPDEYLDDLQRRVKAQTLLGTPFFDQGAAAAELAQHNPPAYFLDSRRSSSPFRSGKARAPISRSPFNSVATHYRRRGNLLVWNFSTFPAPTHLNNSPKH